MLRFHVREVERLVHIRFPACTRANLAKRRKEEIGSETNDEHSNMAPSSSNSSSSRLSRVGAMLGIIDLDGFGLSKFSSDFISFVKRISKVDQENYPEILGNLVVVNAPSVISTMWPVIRCFLDKRTQNKVLLSHLDHAKDNMTKNIDLYYLLCHFD